MIKGCCTASMKTNAMLVYEEMNHKTINEEELK